MDAFILGVRRISQACGIASALLLLAAVVSVCHLVWVRYLLGGSAIWQHEFTTFALIGATFIGSPYVLLTRGHVNVDLLPHYLSYRARFLLCILAVAISFVFCVTLAWTGFDFWHKAWANNWRNQTVWAPPLWIPYFAVPLGMGLLSLQLLADFLALVTRRDPPFGMDESHRP